MTPTRALAYLRNVLDPGDRVYTCIMRVSASGMSRTLKVFVVGKSDGQIHDITPVVARVCGYTYTTDMTLRVKGAGFDAGADVVYNLGARLWPKGTPEPHGVRNGYPDSDGGYALRHERL